MGCLSILLPMVVLLSLLAWAIPNETVPRVVNHADGSTQYVFQSVQESILWVAGAALLVILVVLYSVLFRVKKQPKVDAPARTGVMGLLCFLGRGAGRIIGIGLLAILAMIFLMVILFVPATQFRSARISNKTVTLQCLYRTRTIPIEEIQDVYLQRKQGKSKGTLHTDLKLIVQSDSGNYRSVGIRRQSNDRRLPGYINTMEKFVLDIKSRMKVRAQE